MNQTDFYSTTWLTRRVSAGCEEDWMRTQNHGGTGCRHCIWWSTGFGDETRGSGWCYSEEVYTDPEFDCSFWQASLRDEPVLAPDDSLLRNVAVLDIGVED
jgi:hypothetical protein